MKKPVRFGVITDLHVDIMHDAVVRMKTFLDACKAQDVDFILHLGDIMYPEIEFLQTHAPESIQKREESAWFVCSRDDEKLAIKKLIRESGLRLYGVLGNHDMDSCSKQTACAYWNIPNKYYTFTEGGIRFLALDTNYFGMPGGAMIDFDHCNYGHECTGEMAEAYLPKEELDWIEQTVMSGDEPCVLLAHAALGDGNLCPQNAPELWQMIDRLNRDKHRVILSLNGHNHVDGLSIHSGVPFISVNSASNIWIGHRFDTIRYSETISRMYPHITGTAPYRDALYAIFEISDEEITMHGPKSVFVGPSPQELGFPPDFHEPSAVVRDRVIPIAPLIGDGKAPIDAYVTRK